MGMPQLLLFTMFYFVCMAIDVVLFFLIVRVLVTRWPTWWLVGFDAVGSRLIDGLLSRVQSLWARCFLRQLSDRGQLLASIVLCYAAWLAAHGIAAVVW